MAEIFEFHKFSAFISDKNWRQALEYKNQCIPDKLYHYFPLFDDRYRCYRKENKKRLFSLQNRQIWMSSFEALNDPFEFNGLFFHPENNEVLRNNTEYTENILRILKKNFPIFCLSDNFDKNMPLWAHYSNNHKGYCIEYSTIDKSIIFPVIYVPNREPAPNIITTIITELNKGYKSGTKPNGKLLEYFMYLFISFMCKHELWSYEGEYRLFWMESNSIIGQLVNLEDAKLKIDKIYMGLKCDYKKELRRIGKGLGCEVHEMILDSTNSEFSLKTRRVF